MTRSRTAVVIVVVPILVGLWRGLHPSGEIGIDLLFGWVPFLNRVIPGLEVRWDGVATFFAALLCVTVLAHVFLRWLHRELATLRNLRHSHWRIQWTLTLMGLVVVMFVAGISVVGATHQTAWIATSPTPMFGRSVTNQLPNSRVNLRWLGLALASSSDAHGFPFVQRSQDDQQPVSWVVPILPYLGGGYLPEYDPAHTWNDPVNAATCRRLVPELINPELRNPPLRDAHAFGLTHYAGNSAVFDMNEQVTADDFPFGQANLLLIGEVNSEFIAWGNPDSSRDPEVGINVTGGFGGGSPDGANFLMSDGSVRLIDHAVDNEVLRSLSRPAR